jgi:hypothetical protein
MAYTVVSVFPVTVDTEEIKKDLKENGFDEANIIVSKSNVESGLDHYQEDEQTKGFFDYVFAHDAEMLDAYRKHSIGRNNVIVYTNDLEQATSAKSILNRNGALEVYKKQSENQQKDIPEGMSEHEYNGIIAKAKHDIYFLDPERTYRPNSRGMEDTMDDLGSKD